MMYLLTPEEHAQIVDALDNGLPEVRQSTLAMLKSMKVVSPTFYMSKHQIKPRFYREGETLPTNVVSLYAKEQQ